jgi:hypothetical protein
MESEMKNRPSKGHSLSGEVSGTVVNLRAKCRPGGNRSRRNSTRERSKKVRGGRER